MKKYQALELRVNDLVLLQPKATLRADTDMVLGFLNKKEYALVISDSMYANCYLRVLTSLGAGWVDRMDVISKVFIRK